MNLALRQDEELEGWGQEEAEKDLGFLGGSILGIPTPIVIGGILALIGIVIWFSRKK